LHQRGFTPRLTDCINRAIDATGIFGPGVDLLLYLEKAGVVLFFYNPGFL
jgi:hypothetical protein